MNEIKRLLQKNREWSEQIREERPTFFQELSERQTPTYLWIGCSDSRVPPSQLVGLMPGEVFVHRNVANVVVHTDFNLLSVLQYAIEVLAVRYAIVCGHYGCGGVAAASQNLELGLIDNWLRHVQDVGTKHADRLASISDPVERANRICELNVIEQVLNIGQTTVVQSAWRRGQFLRIHGLIYGLHDGLLRDLGLSASSTEELYETYEKAVQG